MFNVGDRVKFTNHGSWYNKYNGYEGEVIKCFSDNAYKVEFDEAISDLGLKQLYVKEQELELIKKVGVEPMEAELFGISFLLSEEEGMYAKLKADKESMKQFESMFGFDPEEMFISDEFQDCMIQIIEMFADKMLEGEDA